MKKFSLSAVLSAILLVACNGGGSSSNWSNSVPVPPPPSGNNYLTIRVTPNPSGNVCNISNRPCVSLTICSPVSVSECQTVDNILLDSGSTGLRIFGSLLGNVQLPYVNYNGKQLAECVQYGGGAKNWGPVQYANVSFDGGASVNNITMQVLDANYAGGGYCGNAVSTPEEFRLNGILGVGLAVTDKGNYYSCENNSCSLLPNLPEPYQLVNPIAAMDKNNNGIIFQLPALPAGSAAGVVGYAIFGIDTESNNQPISGVNVYHTEHGENTPFSIPTIFNGKTLHGFLDSGTNALSFNDNSIPVCGDNIFYCPSQTLNLNAVNLESNGTQIPISFNVANADSMFNSANTAFNNTAFPLAKSSPGDFFWGMPFYYGRTVYIGFVGRSSSLGRGPYWAF